MPRILLTHDRHIIAVEPADIDTIKNDYPGSFIETHAAPAGTRSWLLLNSDGTIGRELNSFVHETVDTRLEEIELWAPPVYNAALRHGYSRGDSSRANRIHVQNSANVIQGFVYNTVLVAHNAVNRRDNAKWAILKNNMQSWIDIGNSMSAVQSNSLNGSLSSFFSVDSVYVLVSNNVIRARFKNSGNVVDTIDTNLTSATAPIFGLEASHVYVRRVLEIPYE